MIRLIRPSHTIETPLDGEAILLHLERAARTCYKSEGKIAPGSAEKLIRRLVHDVHHESVIEHFSVTVRFICDRGISHELVRHRLASFSQESTRYVKYGKEPMEFVLPSWMSDAWLGDHEFDYFDDCISFVSPLALAEITYKDLLSEGWKPEQARAVLPNALKTEIVMTANLREWRHILKLRTAKQAHPDMLALMLPLLEEFKRMVPVIFEDL